MNIPAPNNRTRLADAAGQVGPPMARLCRSSPLDDKKGQVPEY